MTGFRAAVDKKCKDCIYDPLEKGAWREQVWACTMTDCGLWPLRTQPKSDAFLAKKKLDKGDNPVYNANLSKRFKAKENNLDS